MVKLMISSGNKCFLFLRQGRAGGKEEEEEDIGKTTKDEERKHSIISHNPFANHQSTARPHKWSVQTVRRRIKLTEQSKTKGQFLFCFHQCATGRDRFFELNQQIGTQPTAPDNSTSKTDHLNHMNGPIERLH